MQEHKKPWNALSISEVAEQFKYASFPWWIAGGYAIELAVGGSFRDHADIDVLVLRKDHVQMRALLRNWDCWVAEPPGALRVWPAERTLPESVHDVWCRRMAENTWRFQVMLDESVGNAWVSRRNKKISAPLEKITRQTEAGIPYLAPHIQLYYKAKNVREKDQVDFDAVLDRQIDLDTIWLREAITLTYGSGHPWLARLSE